MQTHIRHRKGGRQVQKKKKTASDCGEKAAKKARSEFRGENHAQRTSSLTVGKSRAERGAGELT